MKTQVLSFILAAASFAGPALLVRMWRQGPEAKVEPTLRALTLTPAKAETTSLTAFAAPAGATLEEKLQAAAALANVPAAQLQGLCRRALSLPAAERETVLVALLRRWAESDGRAAMTWGRDHLYGQKEWMQCFLNTGGAWAAHDSAGLVEWFTSARSNGKWAPVGQGFDTSFVAWLAPSDVVAAARLSMQQRGHTSDYLSNLLRGHIHTAAHAHAIAALLENNQPPPPATRSYSGRVHFDRKQAFEPAQVLKALEQRWPELDPAGWAQWMERHPVSTTGRTHALEAALKTHVAAPGESSANAALAAAPPELQSDIAARIIETWAARDPEGAGTWLNAQGFSETTTPAIEAYAQSAVETDPAAAFAWLGTIPESSGRDRLILTHFTQWETRRPVEAQSFLGNSGWPAERLERLRWLRLLRER